MTHLGCGLDFGSDSYLMEFADRTRMQRVPVAGSLDVTYRCNFRCEHCYVGHLVAESREQADELGTEDMKSLLREAADAGCMILLMSGGEPLLRDDFVELYTAARRLGLIVTVFTNASLIRQEHLEVFHEYPPRNVEVTVYGSSESTYAKVTGVKGSYKAALRGIDRLLKAGIRTSLKSVIVRENVHEISSIAALASELGIRYRVDPLITARLDGDRGPLEQRVEPEIAAETEFSVESVSAGLIKQAQLFGDSDAFLGESRRMFRCMAGQTSFHVGPGGVMHPCLTMPGLAVDTLESGFMDAWKATAAAVERAVWDYPGECGTCSTGSLCGYCPGLFVLEGATSEDPPEYLCRIGKSRASLVQQSVQESSDASAVAG